MYFYIYIYITYISIYIYSRAIATLLVGMGLNFHGCLASLVKLQATRPLNPTYLFCDCMFLNRFCSVVPSVVLFSALCSAALFGCGSCQYGVATVHD